MMSETIILQIPLSEEYDALFAQAREQAGLRKCRCWFDSPAAHEMMRKVILAFTGAAAEIALDSELASKIRVEWEAEKKKRLE